MQLGPGIQKLLTNMMDGDGRDTDLDCTYGDILVQVTITVFAQHDCLTWRFHWEDNSLDDILQGSMMFALNCHGAESADLYAICK